MHDVVNGILFIEELLFVLHFSSWSGFTPFHAGCVVIGCEKGAHLLQKDKAAYTRPGGEHEWLCVPSLLSG